MFSLQYLQSVFLFKSWQICFCSWNSFVLMNIQNSHGWKRLATTWGDKSYFSPTSQFAIIQRHLLPPAFLSVAELCKNFSADNNLKFRWKNHAHGWGKVIGLKTLSDKNDVSISAKKKLNIFSRTFIRQHRKCGAANTHLRKITQKKDTKSEPNGKQTTTQRPRRDIWCCIYFEIV